MKNVKYLTLLLPVSYWVGDNNNLHANTNISKTMTVKAALTQGFEKVFDTLFNDIQVDRLAT